MKLSSNTIGILVVTAIATAAFVWMAKRPAVEANVFALGMPVKQENSTKEEKVTTVEEAAPASTDKSPDTKAAEASQTPQTTNDADIKSESKEEKQTETSETMPAVQDDSPKTEEAMSKTTTEESNTTKIPTNNDSMTPTTPTTESSAPAN